ncbi:hypothetical protein LSH36_583g02382 [Paralvinella palmiformis]|uniref:GMP synthase [glutamine-hydrolyzing] n=1 Tax=Paralvinella palmiformis TaxID=53620 RepID=A0AAD9J5J4_9ANNE|nr:hypothetical protein LSH36_583g02382 [Paralvinella palmiformis]
MSHGDSIKKLPPQFDLLAITTNNVPAAICNKKGNCFALQFHPEVTHTESGTQILQNFIFKICSCSAQWNISSISKALVSELKHTIGTDKVLLGISGGVDSAVSALLLHKAIGKQLHCMFIDTGLLRKYEANFIVSQLSALNIQIHHVNAQNAFLKPLQGVTEPNKKRKIIGNIFIRTFKKESKKWHRRITWLAQGTIYSDVIESAGNHSTAHIIKPHHNLRFRLIEPIRDLFKDEVRTLGRELGLLPSIIQQHPFPGPGLAIRIIGKITPLYLRILREADTIFIEELKKENLYHTVDQAFAVFLPLQSVGVTGDQRRYAYTIALRAVQTKDYMTAQWAPLEYPFLQTVSRRITNEIPEVTRVVYDISSKPPATIEWE